MSNRLYPCKICQKLTDQTCSLCRKAFYCSAQHQQIDWHMRHKLQCEGKIIHNDPIKPYGSSNYPLNSNPNQNDFTTEGSRSENFISIGDKSYQVRTQNEAQLFMQAFEDRLVMRKRALDCFLEFASAENPNNEGFEALELSQELVRVSVKVTNLYKPNFTTFLQQKYGITTSEFLLKLDEILDKCLLARCNYTLNKHQEARRFLFSANQQLPEYPNIPDPRYRQVYENTLKSVMKLSELYNNDKTTERILARFIKVVEKFDGIWEKIFAYFNMGLWYAKRTYYHKAIKCFDYAMQTIDTHQKGKEMAQNTVLVRSDLLYNVAVCMFALNEQQDKAVELMQESYRLRVRAIGKNAIQTSECLECLARWAFGRKNIEDCFGYAMECYRIRKLNPTYPKQLERIQKLLEQINSELKQLKQKSVDEKQVQYYQNFLSPSKGNEDRYNYDSQKDSFIKQLNQSRRKEKIPFKVIITPQITDSFVSHKQWDLLNQLLELDGVLMEKEQFIRTIFESQFADSLSEQHRQAFIKMNRAD